jgi:hypothetical protein
MTITPEHTVLLVAHNITTLNRLLDVTDLFDSDHRVQLYITSSLSDPFSAGLLDAITTLGIRFVPWEQALTGSFDLVIAASHHGGLSALNGRIVILSHGIGYTKYTLLRPSDLAT